MKSWLQKNLKKDLELKKKHKKNIIPFFKPFFAVLLKEEYWVSFFFIQVLYQSLKSWYCDNLSTVWRM